MFANLNAQWKTTKPVARDAWLAARLQLHWAVQFIGQAGEAWATPKSDYGHLSATWNREHQRFEGTPLAANARVFVDPSAFVLAVSGDADAEVARLPLAGRTFDDAGAWLTDQMRRLSSPESAALKRPTHDMPAHAVGDGSPFTPPAADAAHHLNAWYSNAHAVIDAVRTAEPGASPVRIWPHHFDLATLITLDPDRDPEEARSIGVGMSPGDGSSDVPYWYVNVWPIPENPTLEGAPGDGAWRTEGWVGAVLTGDRTADEVAAFVSQATERLRGLLLR